MEKTPTQIVSELGSRLLRSSRPNKDSLVKSLRDIATNLSQIEQPLVTKTVNKKKALLLLDAELRPLKESIIKHGLLKNRDNDVSLLVTVCVSEIFRILAPKPPFEDKYLKDIFSLFLAEFSELSDTVSPYFSRRAKILDLFSRCKYYLEMRPPSTKFNSPENATVQQRKANTQQTQQSLFNQFLSIMSDILKEEANPSLVDVILENLVKEGNDTTSTADKLASSLIESCTDTLEPLICSFLTSCFMDKDSIQTSLKDSYHEIIFRISLNAPQILLAVIPNITQELLTDQVDMRIKALNLAGRIFAQSKHCFGHIYQDLFAEFLRRFSDKSAEVRMAAVKCGKQCYLSNPSGNKASGVLTAIQERLLDFDDRVRTQALVVACDIMKSNRKYLPSNLISEASERLRDKKISVRKKALQKLTEVYQDYCYKCSEGDMTIDDHFEQIPCKILLLCCDKNCKEFRPQNLELVLSDDLFPSNLPVEERIRHWVQCSAIMNYIHLKSLNSILCQKRRLQNELRHYLTLCGEAKDDNMEEVQRKKKSYFVKLSACFPDASEAEDFFYKLDQMRDTSIFDALTLLLDEVTFTNAQSIKEKFLKTIGAKHSLSDFLRILSTKCSPTIFSSEHVQCLLNQLCGSTAVNSQLKTPSIKLLLVILNMFPSYLRGSEKQFLKLLEENDSAADELTETLSKAAPYISVNFSDYYPVLEKVCLEGTRSQAKCAVSAITSFAGLSDKSVFTELCEPPDYEPTFFRGCTEEVGNANSKHLVLTSKLKSVLDPCDDEQDDRKSAGPDSVHDDQPSDSEEATKLGTVIGIDGTTYSCFRVPRIVLHQPAGMPRHHGRRKYRQNQKRPKPTQEQLEDPEFSDDETLYKLNNDTERQMVKPARSAILAKLPADFKMRLTNKKSVFLPKDLANKILIKERMDHVVATNRADEQFHLSDSTGKMHMHWATKPFDRELISDEKFCERQKLFAGSVKDQDTHVLCWDFTLCDLVSSTAVLYGQMDEYVPLSHMYVCQHAQGKDITTRTFEGEDHSCYEFALYYALKFAKESQGIPIATAEERLEPFDCKKPRPVQPNETMFKIKEVFRYNTLEQALKRLKTHTVSAILICYTGWDDPGIYIGPHEGAVYEGIHEVLMLSCRLVDSKMVITCKSSNGIQTGNEGYIDVSAEVMLIEVGSARKENAAFTCFIKPTHLLYDFYSIDMDVGPYGLRFKENEREKQKNKKFRVEFEENESPKKKKQKLRVQFPRGAQDSRHRSGMSVSVKKVGTHNGSFHCDEALGCFMIRLTDKFSGADIFRTRDPKILAELDAVLDVGGVYDADHDRYDHHQKGFEEVFGHGFITKLSSAGLVYKHFGKEIIAKELNVDQDHPDVLRLFLAVYKNFMEEIDAVDNGINHYDTDKPPRYVDNTHLSSRIGRLNLDWTDPDQSQEKENEAFQRAMDLAGKEFLESVRFHARSCLSMARTALIR